MFAIVTDSSVYLTRREAEDAGVSILPLSYTPGGIGYTEGYADENGDFVAVLQNPHVQTSGASIASCLSMFSELTRKGLDVLCITISSRLSGTYANAVKAAEQVQGGTVAVVDSQSTAGGLALLVRKAAELAKTTDIHTTARTIEEMRSRVGLAFSLNSMESLRKSGRLGFVRQSVGTILNVRPILCCRNGSVTSCGVAQGRSAQIERLIEQIPEGAQEFRIHFVQRSPKVDALRYALARRFPSVPVEESQLGPVVSKHLGASTDVIGIAWITA